MEKYNEKNFAFLLIALSVPFIKTYSITIFKVGGRDSWFFIALGGVMICLLACIFYKTMVKEKCFDVSELFTHILGNFFGKFFLGVFYTCMVLTCIEASGTLAIVLHTNLMIETPVLFFLLVICSMGIFIAYHNTQSIWALCIIAIVIIIVAGISLSILASPYKDYQRLKPFFVNGVSIDYFYALIKSIGGLSPAIIAFFYAKSISKKNRLILYIVAGILFSTQIVTFASIGQISTFQFDRLKTIWFPALIQTQLISQFKVSESGELFVMIQLVAGWMLRFTLTLHVLWLLLKKHFTHHLRVAISLCILLIVPTYYMSKNIFIWFRIINVFVYIAFSVYFGIPVILFLVSAIKSSFTKNKSSKAPESHS